MKHSTEIHDGFGAKLWARLQSIKPTTKAVYEFRICVADMRKYPQNEWVFMETLGMLAKLKGRRVHDISYHNTIEHTNPLGEIGTIKVQLEPCSLRWWDFSNTMTQSKNYGGSSPTWKSGYAQWLCCRNDK